MATIWESLERKQIVGSWLWSLTTAVIGVVYGATIADAAKYGHQVLIPAAEVANQSDMLCIVDGPVERDACLPLFTNPTMQKVFAKWKRI